MNAFLALLAIAVGLQQTTPTPLFRSVTRRVYVDVFVSKNGRPVDGLTADDFVVSDNGRVLDRISLLAGADRALSVVLLVDTSTSVRGEKLSRLQSAARTFIERLSERDEIAVMGIGTRFQLLAPMSSDKSKARFAIDRLQPRGATALGDALHAATILAESGSGRPLVLAFTDGDDNSSWLPLSDVLVTAESSPAVIFAVRVGSGAGLTLADTESGESRFIEAPSEAAARETLEDIARAGGGRLLTLRPSQSLAASFVAVLDAMRRRYIIVFEPTASGAGWHPLDVVVTGEGEYEVRARLGYYAR